VVNCTPVTAMFSWLHFVKRENFTIKKNKNGHGHVVNRTRFAAFGNNILSIVVRTQNRRCKMMPNRNRPTAVHANEARAK